MLVTLVTADTMPAAAQISPRLQRSAPEQLDVKPNAYGHGVNSDQYGRPHTYRTNDGAAVPGFDTGNVKRDAYGFGVHVDRFGRPDYDSKPE
jgi:hypothetical protein